VYPIDERDVVVELDGVPKPRGGAPMSLVLADDDTLTLSYFLSEVRGGHQDAGVAIVGFNLPLMHLLGPPNDEALRGHPLWRRGLDSYSAYRVDHSSLLRRIAVMNYVHPRNDPAAFDQFRHYIFTLEDSTFECVARSYTVSVERLASEDDRRRRMLAAARTR